MAKREEIYQALFNLTFGIKQLKTRSRKLKIYSDVLPAECPALFQNQTGERIQQVFARPSVTTLKCDWYLYLNSNGSRNAPQSPQINDMITRISDLFTPTIGVGTFTLGGLVTQCWIEGDIKIVEGVLGDYSVAIIPIQITVGGNF